MRRPLASALLLVFTACATSSGPTRKPAHEGSRPVLAPSPLGWSDVSYTQVRAYSSPWLKGNRLTAHDPLTTRVQAWADRIHLRASEDQPLPMVPARLVVVRNPAPDAWVSGVATCLRMPVQVAQTNPNRKRTHGHLLLDSGTYREQRGSCATLKADPREFTAWYNALNTGCRLDLENGAVIVRGDGCRGKYDGEPVDAEGVAYFATSSFVHVTTGWLASFAREEEMVFALAHMLGHYYRAHILTSSIPGRYNFLYQPSPRGGRPIRLADSVELDRDVATEGLKRYTPEVEADEFAAEYVAKIGVTPMPPTGERADHVAHEMRAHGWDQIEVASPPPFTLNWEEARARATSLSGGTQTSSLSDPIRDSVPSGLIIN